MENWTHITLFDREYPTEIQAEGMAVQQAVAQGECDKCGCLARCSSDTNFKPPFFAWCTKRKHEILSEWNKKREK